MFEVPWSFCERYQKLLFDNLPSLRKVPLVDTGGTPTGATVSTPGEKVDRVLTLTLVIKM